MASPSIVSRAGVFYTSDDEGKQWRCVAARWVQSQSDEVLTDENRTSLAAFFETYVASTLDFLHKNASLAVCDVALVEMLLLMLQTTLTPGILAIKARLEAMFAFCCIWSLGAAQIEIDGKDSREAFNFWWRKHFGKHIGMPEEGTVYDYWFEPDRCIFETWHTCHSFGKINDFDSLQTDITEVTVPTIQTASINFWMGYLIKQGRAVSVVGPSDSGKSRLVDLVLNNTKKSTRRINLDYLTTSAMLQRRMQSYLTKYTPNTLGPSEVKGKLLVFVDDMNLVSSNAIGLRPTDEFMRELVEQGRWFDVDASSHVSVVDTQYITCTTSICPRAQRHFSTFSIPSMSGSSMLTIFQTFVDAHFRKLPFPTVVCNLVPDILKATLAVHKDARATFRRSAVGYFNGFNVKHVSRVVQGLLMSRPQCGQFDTPESVVRLWCHEVERTYGDLHLSESKKVCLRRLARSIAKISFSTIDTKNALGEAESTFIGDDLTVECRGIAASSPSKQLCFSHITETASLNEDSYECVQDIEKLRMQLKTTLETYNEGTLPKIEVILSEEIILHTARLARILMQPSGHALLFGGIGGAGRRTATRLAAYLCGQTLSQPTSVRVDDFKIHLKELFVQTGVKRERVLLLLPESQIAADHLLALVSEVLMFGCVSRLFNDNEREGIASMIQATGGSTDGAMETCWPIFVRQIRSNLRIVLTASPFSSTFREGCRKFPALTNFTTIDSYLPWSKATLDFLAEYHVKSCPNLFESSPIGFSDVVQRFSPKCHELAVASRSSMVFAGPKSYIEMLSMFVDRLTDSRNERSRKLCRLEVAIEKVREAARSLETLEHDVQVWQKDADFKEEVSHKLAEQVKKTTAVVERQMSLKEAKSASYFTLQAEFEQIVQASVKEVALAAPAVEELNSALDTLRRDEIGDCAAMITLPPGVDEVFGAVMVLLAGINGTVIVQKNGKVLQNDRCWEACKTSLLSNVNGFIEELTKFKSLIEESRVPHVNFLEVRSFLIDENFTEEAVADKLPLATSLVRWVRSVTTYYDKWLDIEPIRAKMAETEKRLERARNELEKQTILFEKLSGELADLTSEFKKAEAERVASAEQVRRGRLKLELGQRLIDALNASIKEWSSQVESLKSNDEHLAAEVLIASAFVSYCGPLESSLRHDLVFQKWIPLLENSFSPPPSILSILASDHDVFRWKSELATCDAKFVENVAIASWSKRWPLLIDPQKHGIAWVKRQDKQIYFATAGKDNALTVVADAITGGHVLVFEKVIFEDVVIEPILLSLFRNSYVERSKIKYARLLEEVQYNENFQLYAQTTQSRPNIPLELQDEMTVIDFSLTERDLENHLAKRILHATSPHLATRRIETSRHNFQTRQRLHVIQRHILKRLDEEAEPAENRELVDALEELALEQKVLAVDLDDRIRPLENGLDALADRYRPVARRGAALFTLMRDLKCMDSKYVYGINLFVGLFTLGVERALAADKRKVPVLLKFKLLARRATKKLRGFSWKSDLLLKPIFDDASRNPFESFRGVANRYVDDNRVISATEQKVGTPLPPIRRASEAAEGEELRQWRNERMMLSVTQVIYRHIARGTHARDKLTLATLLAFMLAGKGCSRRQDIACLVTRWPTPKELKAMCTDLSSWLPRLVWDELVALSENVRESEDLESLTRVPEEINGNSGAWRKWFEHATPEILLLPGKLNIASDLAKLCIIRIMRPDRLPEAIREFNVAILGKALSHPLHVPEEPLHAIYSESSPSRPLVFIMSANSEDLETRIRNLGRHFDYSAEKGNLITFALGCSAAEMRANVGLDAMSDIGGWVLLQSIHLSPGWLPTLENILESKSGTASINFRCFLTIDTSWGFDILPSRAISWETLLGECVKVIDDVDPSLDLNVSMQRAWCCFSSEMLESCEPSEEYTRCLVGLCFFHSLLVYRRRFSRLQGWASNYSMSLTTLKACASTIKDVLNDITGIPWDFLRHAIVESHYASIVNSAWEKKVVEAYASTTFGDTLLEADASLASDCFAPDISKTDYTYVENHIATEIPSHSFVQPC